MQLDSSTSPRPAVVAAAFNSRTTGKRRVFDCARARLKAQEEFVIERANGAHERAPNFNLSFGERRDPPESGVRVVGRARARCRFVAAVGFLSRKRAPPTSLVVSGLGRVTLALLGSDCVGFFFVFFCFLNDRDPKRARARASERKAAATLSEGQKTRHRRARGEHSSLGASSPPAFGSAAKSWLTRVLSAAPSPLSPSPQRPPPLYCALEMVRNPNKNSCQRSHACCQLQPLEECKRARARVTTMMVAPFNPPSSKLAICEKTSERRFGGCSCSLVAATAAAAAEAPAAAAANALNSHERANIRTAAIGGHDNADARAASSEARAVASRPA